MKRPPLEGTGNHLAACFRSHEIEREAGAAA
jgi:hypothetical protein